MWASPNFYWDYSTRIKWNAVRYHRQNTYIDRPILLHTRAYSWNEARFITAGTRILFLHEPHMLEFWRSSDEV